jgi:hypothetical protein
MRQGRRAERAGTADWTGASIRMSYTHLHRPCDDTVSAYVIADEGSTFMIFIRPVRVTKKKTRTGRTPYSPGQPDDTNTQQIKIHHTPSICVLSCCLVRHQYRARCSPEVESVYNRIYLEMDMVQTSRTDNNLCPFILDLLQPASAPGQY